MWTDWARPVPFAAMNKTEEYPASLYIPHVFYLSALAKDTAIILDLPDYDGIEEGLALAKIGWRPIPVYNGSNPCANAVALVDNRGIEAALISGAKELEKISIANDAPPAFLLDSNRTLRYKMDVSVFDNSWDAYGQDFPTAAYFLSRGIKKVVVRANYSRLQIKKLAKDLKSILRKLQKNGMEIFLTDGFSVPRRLRRPLGLRLRSRRQSRRRGFPNAKRTTPRER